MHTTKLPDPTLGSLVEKYKDSPAYTRMRPSSQLTYNTYLKHLQPLHARPISTIARGELQLLWKNLSPGAYSQAIKTTRRLFSWGVENDECETAPLVKRSGNGVVHKSRPHEPWTDAEIKAFKEAAYEYGLQNGAFAYVLDAIEIALATGQRISDVVAMPMSGWDGEHYTMRQTKTGQQVRFKPQGRFLEILERNVADKERFVLAMPKPHHGRLARLRYHFDAVREMVGVTKTFHGLRKTVAIKLRENGATNAQIAALLGHTTSRMVESYARGADQVLLANAAIGILADLKL